MKKKTILWISLLAIAAIGIYFVCSVQKENAKQDKEIVKIGVILPLTGNGAIYGNDIKKGIDLAYEQSILKEKIQLSYEDDAAQSNKGINALNKLILEKTDIVIGGVMSSVANSLLPIANKNKVILLSPKATDPNLGMDDYFFRIWPNDEVDGKVSASYIVDSLRLKRVAVFYPNGDYGVGINRAFCMNIEKKGGTIVYSDGYDATSNDFKTQLDKIKASNPDVLFLPSYIKELLPILKQLNELNCNFYIAGVSSYYENSVKSSSGNLLDKVFFTYPLYSTNSTNPNVVGFVDAFMDKYNSKPNAFSAAGYDCFKLIETTILKMQIRKRDINAENMKKYFDTMQEYDGVTGKLSYDANGDVIKNMRIIWLKNI